MKLEKPSTGSRVRESCSDGEYCLVKAETCKNEFCVFGEFNPSGEQRETHSTQIDE